MNALEKMRRRLFEYFLKKEIQNKRVTRSSLGLEKARNIGILFEATSLDEKQIITRYAAKLKKEGKQVTLLAFFNSKQESENFPFDHFNKKGLDFFYRPKTEEVKRFMQSNFDLLISTNVRNLLPLHYITAASSARFRIGPVTDRLESYDMMIDTKKPEDVAYFLQQMEYFINKMTPKHEPTPA
jgi:hypothetical protein